MPCAVTNTAVLAVGGDTPPSSGATTVEFTVASLMVRRCARSPSLTPETPEGMYPRGGLAGSSELTLSLRVCGGRWVETEAEEGVMAEDWSGEMVLWLFLVVVEGEGDE